jgi:hypothetical protein
MTGKIIALLAGIMLGGISASVPRTFSLSLDNSGAVAQALWSWIETRSCSSFDSAYGLPAGTCATLMDPCIAGTVFSATCNGITDRTDMVVSYNPPGTFEVTTPP